MKLVIGNKNFSSWSLRPWIALREFAIPFEEVRIALRQAQTAAEIARYSPSGKVPCLIDGEMVIWETIAILEYLAERHPGKAIWPRDGKARTHARVVAAEMHAGFQPLRQHCSMSIAQVFAPRRRSDEVLANARRIMAIWNEARERFADKAAGPFLYGAFSAADAMYAPVVSRLVSYSLETDAPSRAYIDAVTALPSYRSWRADAAKEPWTKPDIDGETVIENLAAAH